MNLIEHFIDENLSRLIQNTKWFESEKLTI